jgi:hypothetical protein
MSDVNAAATEPASQSSVATEIGRSVGSIWQRREGTRPANVNTVIEGDSIRCVIEPGVSEPGDEPAPEERTDSGATSAGSYRTEATAAVSRITKRTVSAYITGRDKQTGHSKQTFILERPRAKF